MPVKYSNFKCDKCGNKAVLPVEDEDYEYYKHTCCCSVRRKPTDAWYEFLGFVFKAKTKKQF